MITSEYFTLAFLLLGFIGGTGAFVSLSSETTILKIAGFVIAFLTLAVTLLLMVLST
jgi:hypothetical protein